MLLHVQRNDELKPCPLCGGTKINLLNQDGKIIIERHIPEESGRCNVVPAEILPAAEWIVRRGYHSHIMTAFFNQICNSHLQTFSIRHFSFRKGHTSSYLVVI